MQSSETKFSTSKHTRQSWLISVFASLRFRLILLVFLAVVPTFGLTLYTYWKERQQALAAARKDALQLTELASKIQEQSIEVTRQVLTTLAQLPQVQSVGIETPSSNAGCHALFAAVQQQYRHYANIGVVDRHGKVRCSAISTKDSVNRASSTWFQLAIKDRDFSIGEYQIGHIPDKATIHFGYPVRDRAGEVKAVIYAALDLNWFNQMTPSAELPPGASFTIIDRKGTILTRYPNPETWVGRKAPETHTIETIRSRPNKDIVYTLGVDGIYRLYVVTPLETNTNDPLLSSIPSSLYVSVGIPEKVVFADANQTFIRNLIWLGVGASLMLTAAWIGSELFVIRQIKALLLATKRLGDGDFNTRVGCRLTGGEIKQLGLAFDEMAAYLQRSVSERDSTFRTLEEREKRYRAVVNSVAEVIFQIDTIGVWTFLNPAWTKITGYTIAESIGKNCLDFVHPDDRQHHSEEFQSLNRRQTEYCRYELRLLTKNDELRYVELQAQLTFAPDGTVTGICGTLNDISDRQEVESALAESYNLLQAVVEGSSDAIFVKDVRGRYVLANSTTARIIGKPLEEIIGRDDTEFFTRETADRIIENDRKIMASGETEIVEEIVTANNITRTFLASKYVLRDYQSNIIGSIGIARDITDRKRLENEREQLLEQLKQEKEDLTALTTVTANAIGSLNLDELLEVLLLRIANVVQADMGAILLKENDRLRVRASIGIDAEDRSHFSVPIGQGFAGTIAATQKLLYIEDAQSDRIAIGQPLKQLGIRTMLGVPLQRHNNTIGVLHLDWLSVHPFSDRELHLLEITAERCTIAILNAQLYEQTKQLQARLQLQIDTMPIGCIELDVEFGVIDWNPAAERIFSFTKEEVLGKRLHDLVTGEWESIQPMTDDRSPILKTDSSIAKIDHNITKDGRTIICEWYILPLKADGTVIGSLAMVQDITERKLAELELRGSEKRYRNLFQSNPHPMWVYDFETLRFLDVNDAAIQHYGYSRDEFLAMTIRDIHHAEDISRLLEETRSQQNSDINPRSLWRNRKKDGTIMYVEIAAHELIFFGRHAQLILANDITERKRAEDALRESERRYYTLAKVSPVGIFRTDIRGECLYVNERWCQITGLTVEDSLGVSWMQGLHPEDRERVLSEWDRATRDHFRFESEYRFKSPNGLTTWVFGQAVVETGENGEVLGYVGTLTDITDRKQAEDLLWCYAFYDPLTGLPNRTLFLERLRQKIEQSKCGETGLFAVMLLDLDRFQIVKYSLGHEIADRLLVATAHRLKNCLSNFGFSILNFGLSAGDKNIEFRQIHQQPNNANNPKSALPDSRLVTSQNLKFFVAQVGLDEFAIILADLEKPSDATRVADRISQELQLPFNFDGQEVFVTASIGIAFSTIDYDLATDFLRAADTAMHQCKKLGFAGYALFEPRWHIGAVEKLQLETDLRRAIERSELRVYYQPIVSLKSGRISGFEALVRWQHPTRGFVSPDQFIPLAEETGSIGAIDRWVLREACRQMAIWQKEFGDGILLTISVNLSAVQLSTIGVIDQINQILWETGINPHSLKLEITETGLLGNVTSERAMLEQLKALGIQLSIDDFGTGYSSLARLHQMPIDTLKIDRSFISQMTVDSESLEIVRTILTLAHSLEMDAIAEGVETTDQLAQLRSLQCEYAQGYFISKPVDSKAAEGLLRNNLRF
ncbi:PAS domain S-box protein [Aerosakkonema funiforme]|uniref:PAS domain S-box protein n=1 Tax=Aerosakkonema funiforme TaxID=1246630 RepID=UPI0035BAB92A